MLIGLAIYLRTVSRKSNAALMRLGIWQNIIEVFSPVLNIQFFSCKIESIKVVMRGVPGIESTVIVRAPVDGKISQGHMHRIKGSNVTR